MKFPLIGLRGSEPLAFLAALGVLRGASLRWPSARLSWAENAPFQPLLELPGDIGEDELLTALVAVLRETGELEFFSKLGTDVKVHPLQFRQLLVELSGRDDAVAKASLEYLYALGNEAVADRSGNKLKPTAWHMTAGQQQFLDMARILLRETTDAQLRAAIFQSWQYSDPPPAMRWDTAGERLYALEARNPSSVQIRTVRGANALAFLALPLFPVSVGSGRLCTRGFVRMEERREFFVWPLWTAPLTPPVVSLLVGDARLATGKQPTASLRFDGICAVYRSERTVNDHGYGTLRPSEKIL